MAQSDKGLDVINKPSSRNLIITGNGIEIHRQGRPVSGRVDIESFSYMLIDCSRSMKGKKLDQARKGALNFARDAMIKGYQTGLIQFNSEAKVLCDPQKDTSVLEKSLKLLTTGGTTHIAEAIKLAHLHLLHKKGARTIVIVTDGKPTGSDEPQASLNAALEARNDGIDIIAIGTDDADQDFLSRIATKKDLGIKVSVKDLSNTIMSSVNLLPAPGQLRIR